jgi:hypothetical protein
LDLKNLSQLTHPKTKAHSPDIEELRCQLKLTHHPKGTVSLSSSILPLQMQRSTYISNSIVNQRVLIYQLHSVTTTERSIDNSRRVHDCMSTGASNGRTGGWGKRRRIDRRDGGVASLAMHPTLQIPSSLPPRCCQDQREDN